MAITKSTSTVQIRVIYEEPDANEHPAIEVTFCDTWDDPDDEQLPISKRHAVMLHRYAPPDANNMGADPVPTDLSGYDQDVQDIAAIIWA